MTSRIQVQIDFEEREYYLAPLSVKLNLEEYLKRRDKEEFDPSHISLIDEATGRVIPCQFSPSDSGRLEGSISWIHPSHAHKQVEIIVGNILPHRGSASRGVEIWDRGDYQLEVFIEGEHVTNYIYNRAVSYTHLTLPTN